MKCVKKMLGNRYVKNERYTTDAAAAAAAAVGFRMPGGGTTMFQKEDGNRAGVRSIKIYVARELSDSAKSYEPKFTQWS